MNKNYYDKSINIDYYSITIEPINELNVCEGSN